ncbi:molybdate ABC transporter substrate-binding protein [Marinobacter sp.]|uniref:molybdate ABC transporter substrate-binding protein n=1 Tax=Marinobacter sp. TaxID=50741 RepID=UPI003566D4FE
MRIALLLGLLVLAFPGHALTIAAASSLRQVMPELEAAFREQTPGSPVRVIYGASGKLATQILNGAPYDIFLSADETYPTRLAGQGASATDPEPYAIGRLVLWHRDPQRAPLIPEELAGKDIRRIAIAQPRHAPYGQRAREVLQALNLWQTVEPRLVYGENIGQTAAMVESGAADAGLIAWSLTFTPELADRTYTLIDQKLHSPMTMAMIITRRGADQREAQRFHDFMLSTDARAILEQYGFEAPEED